MVHAEDVKLADRMPEIEKRLAEAKAKHKALRDAETKRREEWDERHDERELRAIEGELKSSALAATRIRRAVPLELESAAQKAGADYRAAARAIERERRDRDDSRTMLERRKKGALKPGELEVLEGQLERCEKIYARELEKLERLAAAEKTAEAAIQEALAKIRREALARAARADRG